MKTIAWAGLGHGLGPLIDGKRDLVDPGLLALIDEGATITLDAYFDAVATRNALGGHMTRFHTDYDLLLTPTLPITAFPVGRFMPEGDDPRQWIDWLPFTFPFNMTGQPAASIPCGFTREGLPVGLQIVGPMHRDALVLRAARAFETARPFADRRPAL